VPGDVAVALSTSGNSANVLEGVLAARKIGLFIIGVTGASGGRLRDLVDVLIAAPSDETPRVQECHILIGHALCDAVEQAMTNVDADLVTATDHLKSIAEANSLDRVQSSSC